MAETMRKTSQGSLVDLKIRQDRLVARREATRDIVSEARVEAWLADKIRVNPPPPMA